MCAFRKIESARVCVCVCVCVYVCVVVCGMREGAQRVLRLPTCTAFASAESASPSAGSTPPVGSCTSAMQGGQRSRGASVEVRHRSISKSTAEWSMRLIWSDMAGRPMACCGVGRPCCAS
jgi:hypothetical protein